MSDILFDPLGMMIILFVGASLVGVTGIILIFFAKNEKLKKGLLYFLGIVGILLSWSNVASTPLYSDFLIEQVLNLTIGVIAIGGIFIYLYRKDDKSYRIARVMVVISVLIGLLFCLV